MPVSIGLAGSSLVDRPNQTAFTLQSSREALLMSGYGNMSRAIQQDVPGSSVPPSGLSRTTFEHQGRLVGARPSARSGALRDRRQPVSLCAPRKAGRRLSPEDADPFWTRVALRVPPSHLAGWLPATER